MQTKSRPEELAACNGFDERAENAKWFAAPAFLRQDEHPCQGGGALGAAAGRKAGDCSPQRAVYANVLFPIQFNPIFQSTKADASPDPSWCEFSMSGQLEGALPQQGNKFMLGPTTSPLNSRPDSNGLRGHTNNREGAWME